MAVRARIGGRHGEILTDIEPLIDSVTWALNDVGRVVLSMSRHDGKFKEEYLRIGNRLFLSFDNGLPNWGGFLGLPRTWSPYGVELRFYTIEEVLKYRLTPKNAVYYGYQAGAIFRSIVSFAENSDPLGIEFGKVWQGGAAHYQRYNAQSVWSVISSSLMELEDCDVSFEPFLDSGAIKFKASLLRSAGEDKSSQVAFETKRNVGAGASVREQGTIINEHWAIGSGSTWDDTRPVIIGSDKDSIAKYGLRQSSRVYGQTDSKATLTMLARNEVKLGSMPSERFKLTVTDNEPATFGSYGLGDKVRCVLPYFGPNGFDDSAQILAMEYSPNTGQLQVVVEVPNEPDYWLRPEEETDL